MIGEWDKGGPTLAREAFLGPEEVVPLPEATFDAFVREVHSLLAPEAAGKGYNVTGADGPNELYDFVHGLVGGPGHALGEIVYKVRRYASKGDPRDVAKIAAWAFLVWRKARSEPHAGG